MIKWLSAWGAITIMAMCSVGLLGAIAYGVATVKPDTTTVDAANFANKCRVLGGVVVIDTNGRMIDKFTCFRPEAIIVVGE